MAPQVEIFRGGAGRRPIWGSERGPGSKMAKIGPLWDREISSRGEFWYMRSSGVKSRACAPLKPTAREAGRQSSTIQNPRQGGQAGSRSPISRRDIPARREKNETLDCVFFPNPLPRVLINQAEVGGWVWGLGFIWPPKWVWGKCALGRQPKGVLSRFGRAVLLPRQGVSSSPSSVGSKLR